MIPEVEIWKVFTSLGVPGLALGILYLLFRSFEWKLPAIPRAWVGPVLVLFMIIVGGIVFYALTLWSPSQSSNFSDSTDPMLSQKAPDFQVKLILRIMGWRVYLLNSGNGVARDITVNLVCWRPGSPGPDREVSYQVHDLIPNSDDVFNIDFRNPHMAADYEYRLPTSGYISVSSTGMLRPKAWAFWIPNSEVDRKRLKQLGYEHLDPWPIIEFLYPNQKPNWGVCVDYPEGVATNKTHWRWNSVKKQNEWRDSDGSWNVKRNVREF